MGCSRIELSSDNLRGRLMVADYYYQSQEHYGRPTPQYVLRPRRWMITVGNPNEGNKRWRKIKVRIQSGQQEDQGGQVSPKVATKASGVVSKVVGAVAAPNSKVRTQNRRGVFGTASKTILGTINDSLFEAAALAPTTTVACRAWRRTITTRAISSAAIAKTKISKSLGSCAVPRRGSVHMSVPSVDCLMRASRKIRCS